MRLRLFEAAIDHPPKNGVEYASPEAGFRPILGARAVCGYLLDPDQPADDPRSTHVWAEVYLPGAGWIAFDPTHRRVGGANLIPVVFARVNRRIMPVTGGYVGTAEDFVSLDVTVTTTAIAA